MLKVAKALAPVALEHSTTQPGPSNSTLPHFVLHAMHGLPYHLMQQWVAVRGVACEQRKLGINWENTMQGKCKRGAFTWGLIAEDWCFLDNGGPRVVPKSKRTKQSVEEE